MSITGEAPGRPPIKCGAPMADITAGILGAMGVLAAYIERAKTGKGQRVDTSLFEAGIVHTYWQSAIAMASGTSPGPMGSAHPLNAPYEAFETSDGWITLGAANQANWLKLLDLIAAPELGEDPRFKDNHDRITHRFELAGALAPIFLTRTSDEWLSRLEAAGVPAGPVLDVAEMHRDPQTLAREMVTEVPHTKLGLVKTLGAPVKFSATPGGVTHGAPLLGEHTREVLSEYSYHDKEIDLLINNGTVIAL